MQGSVFKLAAMRFKSTENCSKEGFSHCRTHSAIGVLRQDGHMAVCHIFGTVFCKGTFAKECYTAEACSCDDVQSTLLLTCTLSAEFALFATRVSNNLGDFDREIKLFSHTWAFMGEVEVLHFRGDVAFASTKDPTGNFPLLTDNAPNEWDQWLHYFECIEEQGNCMDSARDFVVSFSRLKKSEDQPRRGYLVQMK